MYFKSQFFCSSDISLALIWFVFSIIPDTWFGIYIKISWRTLNRLMKIFVIKIVLTMLLRQCLTPVRHKAIIWTNVGILFHDHWGQLSVRLDQSTTLFIKENGLENDVCNVTARPGRNFHHVKLTVYMYRQTGMCITYFDLTGKPVLHTDIVMERYLHFHDIWRHIPCNFTHVSLLWQG